MSFRNQHVSHTETLDSAETWHRADGDLRAFAVALVGLDRIDVRQRKSRLGLLRLNLLGRSGRTSGAACFLARSHWRRRRLGGARFLAHPSHSRRGRTLLSGASGRRLVVLVGRTLLSGASGRRLVVLVVVVYYRM